MTRNEKVETGVIRTENGIMKMMDPRLMSRNLQYIRGRKFSMWTADPPGDKAK
jgi:hypothetical protein